MGLLVRRAAAQAVTIPPPSAVMLYLDDFTGGRCRSLVGTGDRVVLGQVIGQPEAGGAAVHASVSGVVRAVGGGAVILENDGRDTPSPRCRPLPTLEDEPPAGLLAALGEAGLLTVENAPLLLPTDRPCPLLALSLLDSQSLWDSEAVLGGFLALQQLLEAKRTAVLRDRRRPDLGRRFRTFGRAVEDWSLDPRAPLPLERLTGQPARRGISLGDRGCVVLDSQGAAAVWEALYLGLPYVRRQVLVTGPAGDFSVTVPIGTAAGHILSALGLSPTAATLSGRPLRQMQEPIGKSDGVLEYWV